MKRAVFLIVLILIGGVISSQLLVYSLGNPQRFPIRHIQVTASYEHLTQAKLKTILLPFEQYGFFMCPTQQLRDTLLQEPWVTQAHVKRHYPDTLSIRIQEKHPIATWNGAFLTEKKEIFSDPSAIAETLALPHLIGPSQDLTLVLRVYDKLNQFLTTHHLAIRTLQRRDNHAWDLKLTNGIRLKLGKKEIIKRIERFCRVLPSLKAENPTKSIEVVDLRYPDALTVRYQ